MFKKDLEFGKKYELELLKYVDYDTFKQSQGIFKGWDIKIYKHHDNIKIKVYYEVKADRIAHKTNNICIEYKCNEKESGITTSDADYWAYFIIKPNEEYDLYIIPTSKIRKYIMNKNYIMSCNGGDNKRSKLYLFSLNKFIKYKKIIPAQG